MTAMVLCLDYNVYFSVKFDLTFLFFVASSNEKVINLRNKISAIFCSNFNNLINTVSPLTKKSLF